MLVIYPFIIRCMYVSTGLLNKLWMIFHLIAGNI